MSCILHDLHPSCCLFLMSCIPPVLQYSGPAYIQSCHLVCNNTMWDQRKMASVCWNHRLGCLESKGSSLTGTWGPDVKLEGLAVVVVVVSTGVLICAVESWEARLRTKEEEGDGSKAVAAATGSSSASGRSWLVNISLRVQSGSLIWRSEYHHG